MNQDTTPLSLAEVCRNHARMRARQRYSHEVAADIPEIEELVRRGGKDVLLLRHEKKQATRSLYAVRKQGKWYPVIFDSQLDVVVTFLPLRVMRKWVKGTKPKDKVARPAPPSSLKPGWMRGITPLPCPDASSELDLLKAIEACEVREAELNLAMARAPRTLRGGIKSCAAYTLRLRGDFQQKLDALRRRRQAV